MDKKEQIKNGVVINELSLFIASAISSYVHSVENHTTVSIEDILQAIRIAYNNIDNAHGIALLNNMFNDGKSTENKNK